MKQETPETGGQGSEDKPKAVLLWRLSVVFGPLCLVLGLGAGLWAQSSGKGANTGGKPPQGVADIELVEKLLAARKGYQQALEKLRLHYLDTGDVERARWAEDEIKQYHRIAKQAYRLDLDVPPPTLQGTDNIPAANKLYQRAMTYKDKGWNWDYIDNQRRTEILLQKILSQYPQCDKIGDVAYQLGDLYESKAYRQYRRAAMYFERSFQWNRHTHHDSRIRAARLYDKYLLERGRAIELYKEVTTHETDPKWIQEAEKRLTELSGSR
jgi:tetratricopeptide (TPR) repeat protein